MPPPRYDEDQGHQLQPLKGITVVTLEHAIAAPFATRQLAGVVPELLPPGNWDSEGQNGPRMDPVPALGQQTDAILAELGLDSAAVAALHLAKAV